ncbi:MAG: universal stress protein, partial [Nitrosopumilus sp.]|nr:universal stress protein [Nitrosopumilus sp.]
MSMKIKKILVPLDGSSNSFRGLDVAIHMARQCQATITGLYVVGITKPRTSEPITPLEKILLEHAQKIMKKAKLKAGQKGILFFDRVSYGDDGKRIVDIAARKNFDLIVIGSRGMGAAKEIFLGST